MSTPHGTLDVGALKTVAKERHDAELAAAQQRRLAEVEGRLAADGHAGIDTADEILDAGSEGLRVFEVYLPLYTRLRSGRGASTTLAAIKAAYDAERGLSFEAFRRDARSLGELPATLMHVDESLARAYRDLVEGWDGAAAEPARHYVARFIDGEQQLIKAVEPLATRLELAMAAAERAVYDKARTVLANGRSEVLSGLHANQWQTLVEVHLNGADGSQAEAVLAWFGVRPDVVIGELDHTEQARALASVHVLGGTLWVFGEVFDIAVEASFAGQLEGCLSRFTQACRGCQDRIRHVLGELIRLLQQVPAEPFRAVPGQIRPPVPGPLVKGLADRDERHASSQTGPRRASLDTRADGLAPDRALVLGPVATAPAAAVASTPAVPPAAAAAEASVATSAAGRSPASFGPDVLAGSGHSDALTDSPGAGVDGPFVRGLPGSIPAGALAGAAIGDPAVAGQPERFAHALTPSAAGPGAGSDTGVGPAGVATPTPIGEAATATTRSDASTGAGLAATVGVDAGGAVGADGPAASGASSAAPGTADAGSSASGAPGLPMGGLAGMGAPRGGERQASARKYPVQGEVVGTDELAEWDRLGPVIGEHLT